MGYWDDIGVDYSSLDCDPDISPDLEDAIRDYPKKHTFKCSDGFCGASDCSRCSPGCDCEEEE